MKREFEELIESQLDVIAHVVARRLPGLSSLILGGSFARGEGTVIEVGGRLAPFKDYDLFAVLDPRQVRSASRAVPQIRSEIYRALDLDPYSEETPSPGKFQISLEILSSSALHSLPHDLSNLELKLTGRVIWGKELLEKIPTEPSLVPSTSGLRHVLNKLLGLLEQWGPWVDERRPPSREIALTISYHRAKVLLDLASAILLVRGAWVAGYGARLKRLKELETSGPLLPSIGLLGTRVEEALHFKLNPTPPPVSDAPFLWEEARDELLRYVEAISATVLC